jgi:glycosyltransferase involved in cell wall biosynthesis
MVDGQTGYLRELGDVPALAAAVRTLVDDRALAERMGEAAQARAERCFSAEASVARYVEFYRRVLAECRE